MSHTLVNTGCLEYLGERGDTCDTIFADPPDNLGLMYSAYHDQKPRGAYVSLLQEWLHACLQNANTVWMSFNAKWVFDIGCIVSGL